MKSHSKSDHFFFKFWTPFWSDVGVKMVPKSIQKWTQKLIKHRSKSWKQKSQKLASRLDGSTIFKVSGPLGKPILAHLGAMLPHLGAMLGYPGPSWRHLGTTWRQDGTQERQEANLQRPPWHKWTSPEAVRGRQARWRVIRRDPISPSPDPSPCSYQRGQWNAPGRYQSFGDFRNIYVYIYIYIYMKIDILLV